MPKTAFHILRAAIAFVPLLLLACAADNIDLGGTRGAAANWAGFGGGSDEQHFSPLAEIRGDNVHKLGLAWSFDLPPGNASSIPVAVDGVLYVATGYSVVRAFDAPTGRLLWEYDPKAPEAAGKKLRLGWGIRGLAYGAGRIFVGTHDGRLIALAAKSGTPLWQAQTLRQDDLSFISGAPRYFDGKVIIGFGGADADDLRGYVTTYDAATGKQLWRFYTVPGEPSKRFENGAMSMAAKTWSGQWWKYGGGGTVWNAMTYDRGENTIILGVGNGSPWNHRIRSEGEGDNLFLASIVGLDAKTGAYKWHYQVNPGETWDYNASMDIAVADLMIDSKLRRVLITAPKNGFFYVIDRTNGKLISAEPFVKVNWASRIDRETGRPVEDPAARFPNGTSFTMWPGPVGAHSWQPMAFSPKTGLVYIPAIEFAASYSDAGIKPNAWRRTDGERGLNLSFDVKGAGPLNGSSALIAWDPVHQRRAWSNPAPGLWNGGILATGGNIVFQGRIDGSFNAFDAETGKPLWSFPAQAPILAAPISYSAGGRQYVTVLVGFGTSAAAFGPFLPFTIDYRMQARRVLTFALDGKGTLPKAEPFNAAPIEDPRYRSDPAAEMRGLAAFGRNCAGCHGIAAVAAGQAPDLRASEVPLDPEAFASVVREGLLVANGMPAFGEFDDAKMHELRQYIRSEGRKWAKDSAVAE